MYYSQCGIIIDTVCMNLLADTAALHTGSLMQCSCRRHTSNTVEGRSGTACCSSSSGRDTNFSLTLLPWTGCRGQQGSAPCHVQLGHVTRTHHLALAATAWPHLARGNGLFGALPLWGAPVLYTRADSPAQAGKLAVTAAGRTAITGRAAGPQRLISSSATATALPFEHVANRSWWSGLQPLPSARRPLHMLGASFLWQGRTRVDPYLTLACFGKPTSSMRLS